MYVLVRLYKVYVRRLLESSTQVWNPWLHKDIKCIERVQRFFTRAIYERAGIPYMDYGNRLANLGLQSLEYRRVYYNLVICYITIWLIFPLTASSSNWSGHITSEVILVSCDPQVYISSTLFHKFFFFSMSLRVVQALSV